MRKVLLSLIASLFVAIGYANPVVITEQPEGELRTYIRSGISFESLWGYYESKQDGIVAEFVFAADGKTVYWKNPISRYTKNNTWIKGELNADGTQIVFPAGQYLVYYEDDMYGYQLYHINNLVIDEDYYWESFDVDRTSPIVLTIDGTTIKLEGTDGNKSIIASITDDDEPNWNYYGDSQTVMTPFTLDVVTAPEGLQTSTFFMHYGTEGDRKRLVNVGIDGNDFYIQGVYSGCPEGWLKGSVDGNTVTVNSGQFFGSDEGALLYWVAATMEKVWNDKWQDYDTKYVYADKLTFQFDPSTGVYTGDVVLIANKGDGTEGISRYGTFIYPTLYPYKEVAATPADPEEVDFREAEEEEGYVYPASVSFTLNTVDAYGNDIDADKLYYRFYTDNDQLMTLSADDYNFDKDMTEFRFDFEDEDYNFYCTSDGYHSVTIYADGFKRIGVQAVYRGAGEERVSNIVYSDGTISETAAISSITGQSGTVRTECFDLSGRRITKATSGQIVIKRTVDANGNVKTGKTVIK